MTREIIMTIPISLATKLESFLRTTPADCGRDEVLFDQEIVFDNGIRAAVQVIAPNSPEDGEAAWSQCVLFDKRGCEISVSHPGDSLVGPFHMDYFDDTYIVTVTSA